jgi:apolipoprotein D and lipocalin family protein
MQAKRPPVAQPSRFPSRARSMVWSLGCASLLLLGVRATAARRPPLKTVDHVDLPRYLGRWYEVARLPNWFEKKCDRDVTAEYGMEGDKIRVNNACVKADGTIARSMGSAKIVDTVTYAKLKVTFFWPFYGNYWILGLAPDYRWAVVGEPDRKFLWILSRTPSLSTADWRLAENVARDAGYSIQKLLKTKQTSS